MAKETKELVILPGALINSIIEAFADGNFSLLEDFPKFIDDFVKAQQGIEGAGGVPDELKVMTNEQHAEVIAAFKGELSGANFEDAYDIAAIMGGVLSGARLGFRRAHQKGLEEGINDVVKKIQDGIVQPDEILSGKVSADSIIKMDRKSANLQ